MLVLVVVVLGLDVFGLCGEKGIRAVMILFDRSDGEAYAFSSTSTSPKGPPSLFRNGHYLDRNTLRLDQLALHIPEASLQ